MPLPADSLETLPDASVSCLMVTLPVPERLDKAKQAIADFCRQSLVRKRLVVVINGGEWKVRDALRSHIAKLKRQDIQVVTPSGTLNLGQLRNISLEAATGELVCQWDDDDRVHPERLAKQAAVLLENHLEAVYLQEVMQYFPNDKTMFWTNWRGTPTLGHPGTLMARRSIQLRYPTQGDVSKLGEDRVLAEALMARGKTGFINGAPHLYVYVSHGANSWHDGHHAMLRDELAISCGLLERREHQIRTGLEPYGFPEGIAMRGNNGEAFVL